MFIGKICTLYGGMWLCLQWRSNNEQWYGFMNQYKSNLYQMNISHMQSQTTAHWNEVCHATDS